MYKYSVLLFVIAINFHIALATGPKLKAHVPGQADDDWMDEWYQYIR